MHIMSCSLWKVLFHVVLWHCGTTSWHFPPKMASQTHCEKDWDDNKYNSNLKFNPPYLELWKNKKIILTHVIEFTYFKK